MSNMKKEISLKELREIQLNILDKIDAFCRELNIRYSLGGGTLLGAVRHKGYIPWDDDIDIMMPRPDYEKFIESFDGVYRNLKLSTYKNDPKCCKPFARIYDTRTYMRETLQVIGINVEVFAIDGLPSTEEEIESFFDAFDKEIHYLCRSTNYIGVTGYLLTAIKYCIKRMLYPSRAKAVDRFQRFISTYDFETSKYAASVVGAYRLKEVMPTEVFKKYIDVDFEGRRYMAISGFDSYLSKHYGNYMELPPKEKQISMHTFKAYWV